jgi:MFS family permease
LSLRTLLVAGAVAAMVEFDGTVLYLALPAIGHEFAAPVGQLALAGTVLTLGAVFGLPLAALADRRGRRLGLAIATGGFATGNLLSGLAPTLALFAAARLVAVTFASVALGIAIVVVAESAPPRRRGLFVSILSLGAGCGAGLTAILYPILAPHWRYLYLLGGLAWVLVPAVLTLLPETRAWEEAHHADVHPLRVLAATPWRARLVVIAAVTASAYVADQPGGLFGAYFASGSLGLSPVVVSAVLIASAPFSLAGYLSGGWLSDRAGRRAPGIGLWFMSGIAAAITYIGTVPGFWAGNLAWGLFEGAAQPIISTWFAELFPTRARASSQAVAIMAGAVGGVIGLVLLRALQPVAGLGPALVFLAVAPMAGALVLLVLPETRGKPLPD